jgi:hypothetical protein
VACIIHPSPELGGEHDILAAGPEHLGQDRLGAAAPTIDVGAIEKGDAQIERLVDDRARRREIEGAAKIVAAEPDRGNPQV